MTIGEIYSKYMSKAKLLQFYSMTNMIRVTLTVYPMYCLFHMFSAYRRYL